MNKKMNKGICLLLAATMLTIGITGCGSGGSNMEEEKNLVSEDTDVAEDAQESTDETSQDTENTDKEKDTEPQSSVSGAPDIEGLTFESEMSLTYAECFHVYYYNDGFKLLDVPESGSYLIVPEGKEAPEGLDENVKILQQPLENIYLAATSAMALFDSLDGLGSIRFSGTQANGWYIDNAVKAMENGDIVYAGKYSEPDYELLVDEGCDLAIESTMILHTPKVQEMIEMLDIPVFMDRSSYETHPLGRTEWIKAYGAMLNKEAEAETFFEDQAQIIEELKDFENTGKTVAIFYMNTNGVAVVRKPSDYMAKMVEIAGAKYAFFDVIDDSTGTTMDMTMEEFYSVAVDADYLIYNASIDSSVTNMDALLAKSELFADFKAIKDGNVWTTGKSLYQATDIVGQLIRDVNLMITDGDESDMTFLTRLQ